MPPSLHPPPDLPDLFDIARSGSPVEDDGAPAASYEGLELTVYGLERTTPLSAAENLRKLVDDVKSEAGSTRFVDTIFNAFQIRQADARNALDYAYISLNQSIIPQPRADILQDLRKLLMASYPHLKVMWRTHAGLDKTRRITFAMDSQRQAETVGPKLDEWLATREFPVLSRYISRPNGAWRVTYDLLKFEHVEAVYSSPPVIDSRTFYPNRPRFITPSYGYQVAVLGCRDWQAAKGTLDGFIREFCKRPDGQDPVPYSRMELGGDVYTAVLRDWDSAVKVAEGYNELRDYLARHPVGRYVNPTPQPGLLYGLNGSGLFFRQGGTSERSSTELTQLRYELDAIRQQGLESMQTIFASQHATNQNIAALGQRLETSVSTMASLAALQGLGTQIIQGELAMSDLRNQRNICEMIVAQANVPDDVRQRNLIRMRQYEEELEDRREQLKQLREQQSTLNFGLTASLTAMNAPISHAMQTRDATVTQPEATPRAVGSQTGSSAEIEGGMEVANQ